MSRTIQGNFHKMHLTHKDRFLWLVVLSHSSQHLREGENGSTSSVWEINLFLVPV